MQNYNNGTRRLNMDFLQFVVLYTVTRLGVFLALVIFGAFTGKILVPAIVTFMPYKWLPVKEFLTDSTVSSVVAAAVVCLILSWVLYDDARKHTAYDIWDYENIANSTGVASSLIIDFMIYFVPAIFRDSFHEEGRAHVFYLVLYYPCSWACELAGNYLVGVLLGSAAILGLAFAVYVLSFKKYVKKHKASYEKSREERRSLANLAAEYSEDEDDDPDGEDDF